MEQLPKIQHPGGRSETSETSERQTAVSSHEQAKRIVENLTARFPRFRQLIFALATAAPTLLALEAPTQAAADVLPGHGSRNPYARIVAESRPKVKSVQTTLSEALSKISDRQFLKTIGEIKEAMNEFEFIAPKELAYFFVEEGLAINNGLSITEKVKGNLANAGFNFRLENSLLVAKTDMSDGRGGRNTVSAFKSMFSLMADPKISTFESNKIISVVGVGATEQIALRNALSSTLQHSAEIAETEEDPNSELKDGALVSQSPYTKIQSGGAIFVKEYKLIYTTAISDATGKKSYSVDVKIRLGAIPEEKEKQREKGIKEIKGEKEKAQESGGKEEKKEEDNRSVDKGGN